MAHGISVDIVDEECDISGYKLVIAPMLYLLREGFEEKLKAFVDQGGTLIGTYHTGIVNDCDLTYLGGWPGAGLMEVFGVWNENIDALWDEERNTLQVGEASYETKDLCALIHPQGGPGAGHLRPGLLQGRGRPHREPVREGPGLLHSPPLPRTASIWTSTRSWPGELALTRALPQLPPEGVEACLRESGDTQYLFPAELHRGEARPSPCRRAMWTWRATPPRRPTWTCTTAKCSCGTRRKPVENTRGESQN